MITIAILGAGAWGTALAVHLARRHDLEVLLWARDAHQAAAMAATRRNDRYLPAFTLPPEVSVTADLGAVRGAALLVLATPVAALVEMIGVLAPIAASMPLVWLSKGLVRVATSPMLPAGVALPHQVVAPRWPSAVGVVSGPSFAEEVARGLPTALAVAATDAQLAATVAEYLRADTLRAYVSDDIAGVEIGGAVKNVLAIAAGASDGLGFGHNARAALITRGLAETGRLSIAMGGQRETLMGLAGLGDLVLTCTGDLSRNRRVGLALAQGRDLASILAELGHVAEGVSAAPAVRALAAHHGVEMPICAAVDRVLHEKLSPRLAVEELLRREPRPELH